MQTQKENMTVGTKVCPCFFFSLFLTGVTATGFNVNMAVGRVWTTMTMTAAAVAANNANNNTAHLDQGGTGIWKKNTVSIFF